VSGRASDDAIDRLMGFLRNELRRDDVPALLRAEYVDRLARIEGAPRPQTSLDELPLPARTRSALRRAGIATAGQLAALPQDERAALPYIGRQALADIRAALGER
jgi:DNA-directed RNA polymerase alpha subunit